MEIPAVVGTKIATTDIPHGAKIILDGTKGTVLLDANEEIIAEYLLAQEEQAAESAMFQQFVTAESISADGFHVELAGNIGKPEDVDNILANGGDGIGLFRTEFLYMDRQELPSEEEQYIAYKTVLEKWAKNQLLLERWI